VKTEKLKEKKYDKYKGVVLVLKCCNISLYRRDMGYFPCAINGNSRFKMILYRRIDIANPVTVYIDSHSTQTQRYYGWTPDSIPLSLLSSSFFDLYPVITLVKEKTVVTIALTCPKPHEYSEPWMKFSLASLVK
jgi:hypothetical protein